MSNKKRSTILNTSSKLRPPL